MTATGGAALLKLAAVGRVVERLLREGAEHDAGCVVAGMDGALGCEASVAIAPLASELRAILDADIPNGDGPLQVALSELAAWSVRHGEGGADPALLAGAMLAEVIASRRREGATWGDFVGQCFTLWNVGETEDEAE